MNLINCFKEGVMKNEKALILRIFLLFLIAVMISCNSSKDSKNEKEVVSKASKKVSSTDGGTVETEDGEGKIEIPAGALD